MQVAELVREFKYNSVTLADPSPSFTLEEVRAFYSNVYPELINAEIEGPAVSGSKNVYTFRRAVGTKGGDNLHKMVTDLADLAQIGWLDPHNAEFIKTMQERLHSGQVHAPETQDILRVVSLFNQFRDLGRQAA